MAAAVTRLKWGRILVGGLLALGLSFLLVFLVITGYAFKLGFEARGAPDQARIEEFAQRIAPTWGPILRYILTVVAAFWVARKAEARRVLHGILVGVMVAVVSFAISIPPDLRDLAALAVTLVAGWIGGALAGRRSVSTSASGP